jgi:hypothetical protein
VTLVIDASVALAWVFEDEKSPVADEVLGASPSQQGQHEQTGAGFSG